MNHFGTPGFLGSPDALEVGFEGCLDGPGLESVSRLCYDNTLYINTMSELPFVFEFHMFVQRKDAKTVMKTLIMNFF